MTRVQLSGSIMTRVAIRGGGEFYDYDSSIIGESRSRSSSRKSCSTMVVVVVVLVVVVVGN